MKKIKITADIVLDILKGIMTEEEINYIVNDGLSPENWQNLRVTDILNIKYFTYRHRPQDTEYIVNELLKDGVLESLERSFCLLSLTGNERVFSKDSDIVTISVSLEYWIQTDKVRLLEEFIENMSINTNGIRIPVQIEDEFRQVLIVFSGINTLSLDDISEFGDMVTCSVDINLIFYPDIFSRSDYTIEFATEIIEDIDSEGNLHAEVTWTKMPFSGFSMSTSMTQKAVPYANKTNVVGSINLSRVRTFVIAFDGYNNKFLDLIENLYLKSDTLEEDIIDNNYNILMKITRGKETYIYDCVLKDHLLTVQEDTGNETHSLTLTTRGLK